VTSDHDRILAAQALRAFAYGLAAVVLGTSLAARGWTTTRVGALLGCVLAGTILASLLVATVGDRIGRRRLYAALFIALALTGAVFASTDRFGLLALVSLLGALSTEVVESGPFTSLEQPMLAERTGGHARTRTFGTYNAVAAIAGSLGALAASGSNLLDDTAGGGHTLFWWFVPVGLLGALIAMSLSPAVEPAAPALAHTPRLTAPRRRVLGLSALFAVDSFGGGFVVQSFIAYYLADRFDASLEQLGVLFFALGVLQTASFLAAPRLAERFGLLNTMVFTHLPSNVLLAAIAFAPSLTVAVALLLVRQTLSQMDVPTRQAYVMALVPPDERTAAAGSTNTARYLVRPVGPLLAGAAQQVALGVPFLLAGAIKSTYDLVLWRWFRHVELDDPPLRQPGRPLVAEKAG
jgi:predicted MFS family arabinose efflux permease